MNNLFLEVTVTGKELGFIFLGIIFGVAALIFFIKRRLANQAIEDLQANFANTTHSSPLEGRNKYPEVDAFKYSGTFLNLGLAISMGVAVLAFGWTEFDKEIDVSGLLGDMEVDFEQEVTRTAEPPPPPPPPPPPVIEEVPDELITEDDVEDFVDHSLEADDEVDQNEFKVVATVKEVEVEEEEEDEVEEIFKVVEQMPRFPGCEDTAGDQAAKKTCADTKLLQFIQKNIKYPAIARENGIQGRCFVTFVVEKNGSVSDVKLVRDIGGQCGKESLRVVKLMQTKKIKWTPGKQRGRNVRVQFNLPVHFRLE